MIFLLAAGAALIRNTCTVPMLSSGGFRPWDHFIEYLVPALAKTYFIYGFEMGPLPSV